MGRYEYAAAREAFAAVAEQRPSWHRARVNLAIATLNRQQEGDERRALDILGAVLAEDPSDLPALYTTAIVHLYLGDAAAAAGELAQVVAADREDAYATYFLGQALLQQGDHAAAARWLQRSVELDPYLKSAYWAGAQALRRIGRDDDAATLLESYQRFDANPAARLAGFSYGRMGPKATAAAAIPQTVAAEARPPGPLFAPSRPLDAPYHAGETLTTADADGDGRLDLALTSPAGTRLLRGTDAGFVLAPGHDLAALRGSAALWGDVDNDGMLDVVACGAEGVRLWRQAPAGRFLQTAPLGDTHCAAAALFDADHDGDLDIFATGDDGNELYNNNRDGSFSLLAASQGLRGDAGRQVLAADLDGDRDQDLLVLGKTPPHMIWQNDRTWRYRPFVGLEDLQATRMVAVTVADADADGRRELYGLAQDGSLARWRRQGPRWVREPVVAAAAPAAGVGLDAADFDGDGGTDLLRIHAAGFSVVDPRAGVVVLEEPAAELDMAIAVARAADAGPAVVGTAADGLHWWPAGPGRHRFLALAPTGRSDADQMRSNASGIGTLAKVRVAGRWTVLDALDPHSGPGQSLQPLSAGLGGHAQADFVALEWSDGVTQTELELASGERHAISETQRQLASCPVFFVWDGARFAFVSDVLGGAALGYLVAPGSYAPPRPVESYLLPPTAIAPKDGRYQVKLAEPMEETAYLDAAQLTVYDLPPAWSMVLDERLAAGGAPATGAPIYFRRAWTPSQVADAVGDDVTALATQADRRAPPPGALDPRFVGLLAQEQVLQLTFAEALPERGAVLVAEGWIEYPYSQTVFAAWQAGLRYRAATLEALAGDGRWLTVAEEFGYPAGMPRTMALPLGDLPLGTRKLRLSSNMEIYWDRLRVVASEAPPDVVPLTVAPTSARLARTGFAERTTGAQRLPRYDYARRAPYWDAKVPQGFYTALGDATPLVRAADGAVAIFGSGEEAHLEFPVPPPTPDRQRFVAVRFHGWAKDMDLYTRHGDTVGPLPTPTELGSAAAVRRDRLHQRYNVRWQGGL